MNANNFNLELGLERLASNDADTSTHIEHGNQVLDDSRLNVNSRNHDPELVDLTINHEPEIVDLTIIKKESEFIDLTVDDSDSNNSNKDSEIDLASENHVRINICDEAYAIDDQKKSNHRSKHQSKDKSKDSTNTQNMEHYFVEI